MSFWAGCLVGTLFGLIVKPSWDAWQMVQARRQQQDLELSVERRQMMLRQD